MSDNEDLEVEERAGGSSSLPVDPVAIAGSLWGLRYWFLASIVLSVFLALLTGKMLASRTFTSETLMLYQAPPEASPESASMPSLLTLLNMVKLSSNLEIVNQKLNLGSDTRTLGGAVSVTIQPKTSLVVFQATWDSPSRAADIANTLRDTFLDSQTKLRRGEAESRVHDVQARITEVNKNMASAEEALRAFTSENRIVHLSEEARTLLEELATVNLLYEQAQMDQRSVVIQAESADRIIKELQSEMAKEQQAQAALSDAMSETNIRIQRLRESIMDDKETRANDALLAEARLSYERSEKLFKAGAISREELDAVEAKLKSIEARAVDTPQVSVWRKEIEELDNKVIPSSGGSGGLTGNLLKDVMFKSFEIRLQETTVAERVESLRQAKERVEARLERLPDLQRTFAQLTRDVTILEGEKGLLETRMAEARRQLEASSLPFTLVSAALPPPRSSSSNGKKIAAGAAFLLLALSCGPLLAFAVLDLRVRTPRELEIALSGAPVIASIPMTGIESLLAGEQAPEDESLEELRRAARQLRTLKPKRGARLIFTSPGYGEGCSMVVAKIAAILGRWGEKVLVIDAHLVTPAVGTPRSKERLGRLLSIVGDRGIETVMSAEETPLSDVIEGAGRVGLLDLLLDDSKPLADAVLPTKLPGVWAIGRSESEGSRDLLGADGFRKRLEEASLDYSIILIDAPPILVSVDAENAALASDGVVMVVRSMGPFGLAVRSAVQRLKSGPAPIAGVLSQLAPLPVKGSEADLPS